MYVKIVNKISLANSRRRSHGPFPSSAIGLKLGECARFQAALVDHAPFADLVGQEVDRVPFRQERIFVVLFDVLVHYNIYFNL